MQGGLILSWKIIMHINYCEREEGQSFEEICKKAVAWGYDGIEFRRKRKFPEMNGTIEEYLDSIANGVEKSGLKNVIFGGPGVNLANNKDSNKRAVEMEEMIYFIEQANQRFKLSVLNTSGGSLMNQDKSIPYGQYEKHGSFIATEEHGARVVEGFKTLGKIAKKLGFKFAFETHMCNINDLPSETKKLVDMIGNPAVGINLDYGNAVYFKDNLPIYDTIHQIKDSLFYVHLKNSISLKNGTRLPTGLSDGEINHREYLKILKDIKYNGPICLEAPRNGDGDWYAKQDLKYIKSVMKDIYR
jgi:sugar phosphate isomerase/epimerase